MKEPTLNGARLAVEFIVGLFAAGWIQEQILGHYPHIRPEGIPACLAYAAELLHTEPVVHLEPA